MNNIITPKMKTEFPEPSKELLEEIEKMNQQLTDQKGQWKYIPSEGVVWKPDIGDLMGATLKNSIQPPEAPCRSIVELVEMGKAVDFDNMPENSVVLVRLNTDNPVRFMALQRGIATSVLDPRIETLKKKKICILFIEAGEDISVMTEEEMKQAGWERKEKSRIITL